jgi:large subunit ribosomal protein L25
VFCSPEDIPESIDVDVSDLEINYSKHMSDVVLPQNIRVVGNIDQTLVTIVPPSGYAEEMKQAAEAAATAAAAAAAAAAAPPAPTGAPGAAPAAPAAGAPAAGGDKK